MQGRVRLILLGASGQTWGLPEAGACPGLLLVAGMRQPLGEAGEHGLAPNLGGLAASGTSTCSMCTPCSSLSCSEELPGKSSRVVGELCGSRVLQPWPSISSHCTLPPVPENKGGPVRVPPVTSAPEHVGSIPWHKGTSMRASLHTGQLIPGRLCHPRPLGEGHQPGST